MPAALTPVSLPLTSEEYIAWEAPQEERHEYIHGEVFARSGASRTHHDIALNLAVALRLAFRGTECAVFGSDMRVQIEAGGRYTYPDLSAACGELTFADARETTRTNPALVVEVLSPSTEGYDRGDELAAFRAVPSIREVVLIRQDRRGVGVYRRDGGTRWTLEDLADGTLALASVGVDVPLGELYAGTPLA